MHDNPDWPPMPRCFLCELLMIGIAVALVIFLFL
jgi:hypothetical protein